jgi:hypothetical protein
VTKNSSKLHHQMLRNPFVVAVAASAGTLVIMGGATVIVSGITISVAKKVVHRQKVGQ